MNAQLPKWRQISNLNLPPAYVGSALVYNAKDQTALLIGGTNASTGYLIDIWSFSGIQWERRQISARPTARYGLSLAWDEARQMAVLFGGIDNGKLLGDTWLFDGTEWYQKQPLTAPSPRVHASLAYEAERCMTILFGGLANTGWKYLEALNEMWVWDGKNWQQQFPIDLPPARFGTSMVYDRARRVILLFGGGSGGGMLDDTWVWDGVNWKEQRPSERPPARADFGMAYHEGRQQVVLFGGQSYNGLAIDTWIWDGKDWSQLQTSLSPPPQVAYGAQLVYLPSLKSVVLYNAFREKTIVSDESFTMAERSEVWVLDY